MSKKVVKYDAPKRPRSAYLIFAAEMRETMPRDHNLSLTDVAKALGERWKGMTAQERQPFETRARVEKEAYETALAEYNRRSPTQAVDAGDEDDDAEEQQEVFKPTPILKNKERRFKKDPNAPKRPRTAFFIFAQEFRESTPRGPDVPLTTFMMEIANRWKAFTMAERAPYDQRALVEKRAYEAAVVAYNAKPRRLETESDDEDHVIEDKSDGPQSDSEHDDDDDEDDDQKAPARQTKVEKKMKQSGGPRRPLASYMFYCQTQTRRPDEQTTKFMLRCGEQWKSLPDHERAPFEQQRAADMARYQREKAEFESKSQPVRPLPFLSHDGKPSMAKMAKKRAVESDEEDSASAASDEEDEDDDDDDEDDEDDDSGNVVHVKQPVHVFAKRDPNAPKHAMSAFMMFSNATRSQIPRDANTSLSEISKRLAMRWKAMTPEEKSTWEAQARADRARYEEELTKYRQSTQPSTQPAAQVKRKRSAFMFYMDAERGSIGPDVSMGERGKILGSRWLAMTPEQKQPWIEMQEEDRRRYEREVAAQGSASQPHANARPKPDPCSDNDEEEDEDEEDEGEYEKPTKSPMKSPMKAKKAPPKATARKKVAIKKEKPLTKVKMGKTVTKKAIAPTSDAEDDEEDDEDDNEDEEEKPSPKKAPLIKEGKKRSRKEEDGNDDEKPVTSPAVKLDMSLDDILKSSQKSSPKKSAPQPAVIREKTSKAPPKKYKREEGEDEDVEEDKPKAPPKAAPKAALMKSPKKEAPKKPMLKKDEDDDSASDGSADVPIRAKAPSKRADTDEEDEGEEEAKPKAPRKSTFMKSPMKSSPAKKKSKRKSDVRKDDSDDDDGAAEEPARTVSKATKDEDDATPKASPGGMAAYREFSARIREQVKAENPEATGAEINKIIGARWAEHKRGL